MYCLEAIIKVLSSFFCRQMRLIVDTIVIPANKYILNINTINHHRITHTP